ncbi:zinc-binding dehydrogenase, partial [Parabacteroides distasonis]
VISKVPKELPREKALLIEPYACSKHAVDRAGITNEDILVIAGAGTLGLGMITYARMKNPAKLIVVDMIDERLEKAKDFGADLVINPSKEDAIAKIMELTEGYGCDIYIEATGHPSSVKQGLA